MNRVPHSQQEHNKEKKTLHKQQKYNSKRELPAVCTIREHSQVSLGDFQPLCELLNPMKTSVSKKTNLRLQCEISGLHLDVYLPRKKSFQLPSGYFSVHYFRIFLIFGLISCLGTVKGRVSLLRTSIFDVIPESWVKYSLRLRYYYYQATVKHLFAREQSRKLQ